MSQSKFPHLTFHLRSFGERSTFKTVRNSVTKHYGCMIAKNTGDGDSGSDFDGDGPFE